MNYRIIFRMIGKLLLVEAFLLILPLIVSFIYKEDLYWSYLIPIISLLLVGGICSSLKLKHKDFFAKEGFVIVGLSWIILSLFGCLPFIISKSIPNFVDAYFETISGFTTTGATIIKDGYIEVLPHSILFWRSFTHWIGGMGILVFVLAILPKSEGSNIHILRAESPGPSVDKIVSKVKISARILYGIYIVLTIIQIIFLLFGKMPLFDSIVHTFATAGTGGFSIKNDSIAGYNDYCQIVIGIFMILFGVNFNCFYLLLIGNFKRLFKSEEFAWYLGIIFVAIVFITLDLSYDVTSLDTGISFATNLKNAFFHVASIITTTGFTISNIDLWPLFSKFIIILLMFIGACAGSTGGGIKVSRIAILVKNAKRAVKKLLHPRSVANIRFEGEIVEERVVSETLNYFIVIMLLFVLGNIILSLDPTVKSLETSTSAVAACLNNVGPGFGSVSVTFAGLNVLSKITLIILMLIGRLEIFPILILFSWRTWKKN